MPVYTAAPKEIELGLLVSLQILFPQLGNFFAQGVPNYHLLLVVGSFFGCNLQVIYMGATPFSLAPDSVSRHEF